MLIKGGVPMSKTDVLTNDSPEEKTTGAVEIEELIMDLYREYEPLVDEHLWPWETKRWHELVFCLMTTIAEPDMSPESTRELTMAISEWNLLDVNVLADLDPARNENYASSPIIVTIETILQQSGFDPDQSKRVVTAICEAASGFKQGYGGKVQKYFRSYGYLMLDDLKENFTFSQLNVDDARKAFAIWLQNTLNMPISASNPITDAVCERLGVEYGALVEAADALDINVALLDDTLRAYWEDELAEEQFEPAKEA
jgi:hypothetical protein